EDENKFSEYLGSKVVRATEQTLEEAISKSGLVIGINSPVLLQAAAAGKKVLSYEPELTGDDPLVSNRVSVTTRIDSKEQLAKSLEAYVRGQWSFETRSMRDIWPMGATERVVQVIHDLV